MKKKTNRRNNTIKSKSRNTREVKPGFFESLFSGKTYWPILIIISVLGIIIYSNTFNAPLQFDDTLQIIKKSRVNDLNNFFTFSEWSNINKRPLAFFTFALNYHFGQYNVVGYHIVNLIIHILSAIIVFFLSRLIFTATLNDKKITPLNTNITALFTALVFLSHPIQTQGVTYIVQRMTSLSAMFYLLSVLCYAIGRKHQISSNKSKAIIFYLLTAISGLFSLWSKQIAVTLPFALLLYEFFFIRNELGKTFKKYISLTLIPLLIATVIVILSGLLPAETENISRQEYFITQFRVIVKYFQLLIMPIGQNVDYYFPLSSSLWNLKELASLSFIIALIGSAVYFYRKFPVYSFGIFWMFITLSVESSIIPIRDVIFEHRLYLPMFGFALIITSILTRYIGKLSFKTSSLILIILIIVYSVFTFNRNKLWASQYTLWKDVTSKSPEKERPWYNLGKICLDDGRYNESIKYLQKSLKIDPHQPDAWYNIGLSLEKTGDHEKAIEFYQKAIKEDSTHTRSMNNLGSLYINLKDYQKAISYLQMGYKADHRHFAILQNLGVAYYRSGDYKNAVKYYKKLLKQYPEYDAIITDIGLSYLQLKEYDKAINTFIEALKTNPDRVNTHIDLGTCYFNKGNYKKAFDYYSRALELDPGNRKAKQYQVMAKERLNSPVNR